MTATTMHNEEGKFLCPHCDKTYTTKGWMTKHIKEKHQESEETSKKNDELEDEVEESIKRTEDISRKTEDIEEIKANFLNTREMERIEVEIEEENFLDAVENLEDAIGLDQDLTVNDSIVKFLDNEENYRSDFGSTMELERNRSLMKKLETELRMSTKTVRDIRKLYKEKDESLKACLIQVKKSEAEKIRMAKKIEIQNEELAEAQETIEEVIKESNEELNSLQAEIKDLNRRLASRKPNVQDEIMFACERCNFASKTVHEVREHAKINHREGDVEVHKLDKTPELHKCPKCPTIFKIKDQLTNHMKTHEFLCFYQGCGALTETEQQMAVHIDNVHLQRESGSNKTSETPYNKPNKKKKECRYFRQGRCTKGDFCDFEHDVQTIRNKFTCGECHHVTNSNATMEKHMKTEHKDKESMDRYQCIECNYVTDDNKYLKIHINNKHQPERVVNVPLCRFYLKGRCTKGEECKFRHNGKQKLNNHMKTEHVPLCKRGDSCVFKAKNKCFYFHPGVGVQQKREDNSPPEGQTQAKEANTKRTLYCKYQEECKKKDSCTFKHFQKGFPNQRQTKSP